jgi:hypothetical protein
MKLQLYYDNLLVGEIAAPLLHQGTWSGDFLRVVAAQDGPLARRICDFITFCREWHVRLHAGTGCEASEFDQFSDLLRSGLWLTRDADGKAAMIEEAPVFISSEISWRLKAVETPV